MIVRCLDATLQRDVLTEGKEYEVLADRGDVYILSGFEKGFTKTRFEVVMPKAAIIESMSGV